jgi:predicted aminopeptidase
MVWLSGLGGCYVTRQAVRQGNLLATRRPVSDVLEDQKTDPIIKHQLVEVRRILSFAEKKGLKVRGAYQRYIDIGDQPVSYLLQAAEADQFKSLTWWFPIVGTVPYLGFFERRERDEKSDELRQQGYDVFESNVGAFSGLGWFEDPIFSSMLINRRRADLANLFFHELTHRTIWLPGKVKLNETFAEFVGNHLTLEYLREIGEHQEVEQFANFLQREAEFVRWVVAMKTELSTLYEKRSTISNHELLATKSAIISRHIEASQQTLGVRRQEWIKKRTWNNASILSISLYQEELPVFAEAFACLNTQEVKDLIDRLRHSRDTDLSAEKIRNQLCGK